LMQRVKGMTQQPQQ